MTQETKIVYSKDEELFEFDELDDVVESVWNDGELKVDDKLTVYSGESVIRTAADYANVDIYNLQDSAYDECGEYAEGWLEKLPEGAEEELNDIVKEAVNTWADKYNLQPKFFTVIDVNLIKVQFIDEDGNYKILEE